MMTQPYYTQMTNARDFKGHSVSEAALNTPKEAFTDVPMVEFARALSQHGEIGQKTPAARKNRLQPFQKCDRPGFTREMPLWPSLQYIQPAASTDAPVNKTVKKALRWRSAVIGGAMIMAMVLGVTLFF